MAESPSEEYSSQCAHTAVVPAEQEQSADDAPTHISAQASISIANLNTDGRLVVTVWTQRRPGGPYGRPTSYHERDDSPVTATQPASEMEVATSSASSGAPMDRTSSDAERAGETDPSAPPARDVTRFTLLLRGLVPQHENGRFMPDISEDEEEARLSRLEYYYNERALNLSVEMFLAALHRSDYVEYIDGIVISTQSSCRAFYETIEECMDPETNEKTSRDIRLLDKLDMKRRSETQQAVVALFGQITKKLDQMLRSKYPDLPDQQVSRLMFPIASMEGQAQDMPTMEELSTPGFRHEHAAIFRQAYEDREDRRLPELKFDKRAQVDEGTETNYVCIDPASMTAGEPDSAPTADVWTRVILTGP